jgi:hypothetical protein
MASLSLPPGRLHQEAEFDARRTHGLAVAAEKTKIHVLDEIVGDPHFPFRSRFDEIDAPARIVHLVSEHDVGRTRRKTETAVDTVLVEFGIRRIELIEGTFADLCRFRLRTHNTNPLRHHPRPSSEGARMNDLAKFLLRIFPDSRSSADRIAL